MRRNQLAKRAGCLVEDCYPCLTQELVKLPWRMCGHLRHNNQSRPMDQRAHISQTEKSKAKEWKSVQTSRCWNQSQYQAAVAENSRDDFDVLTIAPLG